MATRNGISRGYIARAVETILSQDQPPVEVLIIDDASTDGTAALVRERFGREVKVVSLVENCGPSAARNHGLLAAKSAWVAFLDDDDEWLPSKLHIQAERTTGVETTMVCGRSEVIDGAGRLLQSHWPALPAAGAWPMILFRNPVHGPASVLVNREAAIAVGGFPTGIHIGEDWVLWARLAKKTPLVFHEDVVARYRVHAQHSAKGHNDSWVRERTVEALRELVNDLPAAQAALVLRSYAYGGSLRALAEREFSAAVRLATVAEGRVDWRLLIEKAVVGACSGLMPLFRDTFVRCELRRMMSLFFAAV